MLCIIYEIFRNPRIFIITVILPAFVLLCLSVLYISWLKFFIIFIFLIYLLYRFEQNSLKEEIEELESNACKKAKEIVLSFDKLNCNIISKLSSSYYTEEEKEIMLQENKEYYKKIIELREDIANIDRTIYYGINDRNNFGIQASRIYYAVGITYSFNNLDLGKFFKKHESISADDDLKKYRDDWIELYTRFH